MLRVPRNYDTSAPAVALTVVNLLAESERSCYDKLVA
jgi:hypothetical protein